MPSLYPSDSTTNIVFNNCLHGKYRDIFETSTLFDSNRLSQCFCKPLMLLADGSFWKISFSYCPNSNPTNSATPNPPPNSILQIPVNYPITPQPLKLQSRIIPSPISRRPNSLAQGGAILNGKVGCFLSADNIPHSVHFNSRPEL